LVKNGGREREGREGGERERERERVDRKRKANSDYNM